MRYLISRNKNEIRGYGAHDIQQIEVILESLPKEPFYMEESGYAILCSSLLADNITGAKSTSFEKSPDYEYVRELVNSKKIFSTKTESKYHNNVAFVFRIGMGNPTLNVGFNGFELTIPVEGQENSYDLFVMERIEDET